MSQILPEKHVLLVAPWFPATGLPGACQLPSCSPFHKFFTSVDILPLRPVCTTLPGYLHNLSQDTHSSSLSDAQPLLSHANLKVVEKIFHFRTPTVHTTTTPTPSPTHFLYRTLRTMSHVHVHQ